ncbi:MAG: DUF3458 domain-containing protein [Geminicoccaceae bacterium]
MPGTRPPAATALTLEQSTPPTPGQARKLPLEIPIRMGLLDRRTGQPMPLQLTGENRPEGDERVLELREARETFTFENVASRPCHRSCAASRRRSSSPSTSAAPSSPRFCSRHRHVQPLGSRAAPVARPDAGPAPGFPCRQGAGAGSVVIPALQAVLDDAAADPASPPAPWRCRAAMSWPSRCR